MQSDILIRMLNGLVMLIKLANTKVKKNTINSTTFGECGGTRIRTSDPGIMIPLL